MKKISDKYQKQLDIQMLISNSFCFNDYLRTRLSKNLQVILAHQRSRIVPANSDGSEGSPAQEAFKKFDPGSLKKALTQQQMKEDKTQSERRLILGLFTRQQSEVNLNQEQTINEQPREVELS